MALLRPLLDLDREIRAPDGVDGELRELVCLRVSQINGCAYCVDMHTKDLLADGFPGEKITMLTTWREAPIYNETERAALAWAERLTEVAERGVDDEAFEAASRVFGHAKLAYLTATVTGINTWNRIAIAFGFEPGHYRAHDIKRWLGLD